MSSENARECQCTIVVACIRATSSGVEVGRRSSYFSCMSLERQT